MTVWKEEELEQIFVEFEFLGSAEETPDAVAKPKNKDEKLVCDSETSKQIYELTSKNRRLCCFYRRT